MAGLSLARFAAITAALEHGIERPETLARAGLSLAAWLEAQQAWLAALAAAARQRNLDRQRRYDALFLRFSRALARGEGASLGPELDAPSADARPSAPPIAPAPLAAPAAVAAVPAVATSLPAERRAGAPLPAGHGGQAPPPTVAAAPRPGGLRRAALSSTVAFSPWGGEPKTSPALPFATGGGPGEKPASLPAPSDDALPFRRQGGPAPATSAAPRATPAPRADLAGTLDLDGPRGVPAAPAPSGPPAKRLDAPRASKVLTGTIDASEIARHLESAPFKVAGPSARAPTRAPGAKDVALPFQPSPAAGPKPEAGGAAARRLNLQQFASLRAELAVSPERAPEVRKRYGLDDPSYGRELEGWRAAFAASPELEARCVELEREYRAWLEGQRR